MKYLLYWKSVLEQSELYREFLRFLPSPFNNVNFDLLVLLVIAWMILYWTADHIRILVYRLSMKKRKVSLKLNYEAGISEQKPEETIDEKLSCSKENELLQTAPKKKEAKLQEKELMIGIEKSESVFEECKKNENTDPEDQSKSLDSQMSDEDMDEIEESQTIEEPNGLSDFEKLMLQMEEQSRQEQSVKEETEKINQSVEDRIQFLDKELLAPTNEEGVI